jgi:hypothetical protein
MSILSTTNSGLEQIPITTEGAIKMGWKIKKIDDYKLANYKIYNLNRDDVSAELRFWFEPKDELKWCRLTLYFFADEQGFYISKGSSRFREIENLKQLHDSLQFLKFADKCKKDMKELYSSTIGNLKDPQSEYYTKY